MDYPTLKWFDLEHLASFPQPDSGVYRFIFYFSAAYDAGLKGHMVAIADRTLKRGSAFLIKNPPTKANLPRLAKFVTEMMHHAGIEWTDADKAHAYLVETPNTSTASVPFSFLSDMSLSGEDPRGEG